MSVILHVILLCSPRLVGGAWLRDYLLWFAENSNMYVANNSSILQYCHVVWHVDRRSAPLLPHNRASSITVRECMGGGGGLIARAKVQVLVVTPPPPLFFPGSRSQKGGA